MSSEATKTMPQAAAACACGIHLMAKPSGPACNLRCKYCFYLEKDALFEKNGPYRMSDEVLEAYIRGCAQANAGSPAGTIFAWQGGEPTLMGIDFFKKALELEKKYTNSRPFTNTLQTNGTLLDDKWCEFLAKNKFLVGLSLDGPDFIHDLHRIDAAGRPTFDAVLRALKLLQKHGVEYNILACVSRESAKYPSEIYRFFKEQGVQFIQFSPIVERMPDSAACGLGLSLSMPPALDKKESAQVAPWTVDPDELGEFYIKIFDEWVRNDVGRVFVMNFEWMIFNSMGGDGAVCTMSDRCGNCAIVEHNGDVYACDHFVYPEFKLGNILTDDVRGLVSSDRQLAWGAKKRDALPAQCRECEVEFICRGGCPKHRFAQSYDGAPGLNYLCAGFKKFYNHTAKYVKVLQKLLELGLPAENIMQAIDKPLLIKAGPESRPVMIWVK